MENQFDEHIQKLLDEDGVISKQESADDLKAYEALYRLLEQDIPMELPVNFSGIVEARIIAKRERPLKFLFVVLIGCFIAAAVWLFISVYSSADLINIAQAVFQYKWAFLAALLIVGYIIISDYIKIKQSASALTRF